MANIAFVIEMRIERALDALDQAIQAWPQRKTQQFVAEWRAMEDAGAVIVEAQFVGGRVVGYPSEDFTQHMAAWGVYP